MIFLNPSIAWPNPIDTTDSRKKVVVIDTGYELKNSQYKNALCATGHKDFTNTDVWRDTYGHGTNIVNIIASRINPTYFCIIVLKFYSHTVPGKINRKNTLKALEYAKTLKPVLINYSAGGEIPDISEKLYIMELLFNETYIVVAAGNEDTDLDYKCNYYPACYARELHPTLRKKFIVVGNITKDNIREEHSNYGSIVDAYENGNNICFNGVCLSGTSQATAIHSARILNDIIKK